MAYFPIYLPAGGWEYDPTNYPEFEDLAGVNGDISIDWFDDTTEQYLAVNIQVPATLDTDGTVYVDCYGFAKVRDGNEVQYRLSHSAKMEGEDWDAAYANFQSGDYVTQAAQDQLDYISWSATVAALGWAANDHNRIMLSRSAIDTGAKVVGDHGITHTRIRIPIA